jgi:TRAP-type mannitol/chloroaromatic compound transport system permease small subunit
MAALLAISATIDRFSTKLGRSMAWLIFIAILVSTVNALIRKLFNESSNSWLELQWILFGVVFLLCSPWTLLVNEHIRIDIVNSRLPARWQNWIELIGHVFFLLPFTLVMVITSTPFAFRSIIGNEQSNNAGGLPQWPAKTLLLIGFIALLIQAISEIIKRVAIIRGDIANDKLDGPQTATEAEAERLLAASNPL